MTSVGSHVQEMKGPSYVTSTESPHLHNSYCSNSLSVCRSESLITLERERGRVGERRGPYIFVIRPCDVIISYVGDTSERAVIVTKLICLYFRSV